VRLPQASGALVLPTRAADTSMLSMSSSPGTVLNLDWPVVLRYRFHLEDESAPITVIALSPPMPFHLGKSEELDEFSHALLLTAARKSLGSCELGDTVKARPKQFR
jgi:hypothetical protein